ncbi:MAG TPA: hypothetical protein VGK02_04980 [Candidatus Aquicultor sp.]|jgi:hypothetical protein
MRKHYMLDPFWIISGLFGLQLALWWAFMPDVPTIYGAAPRYISFNAILNFSLLWICLLVGVLLGKTIYQTLWKDEKRQEKIPPAAWIRFLFSLAAFSLLLSVIGELIYIREVILNPGMIKEAFDAGNMANVGVEIKELRIVGLSSLNNLFIVPAAIYAMVVFHPRMDRTAAGKARLRLIIIGAVSVLHALLFSARMFPVYFISVVLASYLLSKPDTFRLSWRTILRTVGIIGVIIWTGELLRGGLWYATTTGFGLFSADTQKHILDLLIQGYFAADLNNALVLLGYDPSYQFLSTTLMGDTIGGFVGYSLNPYWTSSFGTVNVLGLWWFDWGIFAFAMSLIIGALLGIAYKVGERFSGDISLAALTFIIIYPGLWSITRINYYFLTIFVLPFVFLACVGIAVSLSRYQRREIRRPVMPTDRMAFKRQHQRAEFRQRSGS